MDELRNDMVWSASARVPGRPEGARVCVGDCLVEPELDRVSGPGGEVQLEPKAMAVLMHLVRHAGRVVSTSELVEVVWLGRPMGDNPVYRCVAQLRRALGDDARSPRYIATVPTKGYRLIAPVAAPVEPGPAAPAPEAAPARSSVPRKPRWRVSRAWLARMRWPGLAVLTVALALTLAVGLRSVRSGPPAVPSLVVQPFTAVADQPPDRLLLASLTRMLRERLAREASLRLIGSDPVSTGSAGAGDGVAVAARWQAGYLLSGHLASRAGRLRGELRLREVPSGRVAWSMPVDAALADLGPWREQAAAAIARAMGTVARQSEPSGRVSLEAYEIYHQGREAVRHGTLADIARALELFRRASILDPAFARAYLGMGQVLVEQAVADPGPARALREEAGEAIARALAIDPHLGEAWTARARLASDPVRAEALYRKGLHLAPSDADGRASYAELLFRDGRVGEAIEAVEQARRLDPRDPQLDLEQAFFVMVQRSDVASHDRLVAEALAIDPHLPGALYQMAYSKWEYSGRFREAARYAERAIAAEPDALPPRLLARDIYLDLGDPARAEAVLGPDAPPAARVEIAQYRGDVERAAALSRQIPPAAWPDGGPQAAKAQALRDGALARGDVGPALGLMQAIDAADTFRLPMARRGFALVRAHTLVLGGHVEEGRRLARATLAMVDAHGLGRPAHWFSRERASAFAVLGDDERALQELAYSVRNGQVYRWWYLAGHDPLFARLRADRRFQALAREARAWRSR